MSKQGIFVAVADSQEGGNPRIVTEDQPFPTSLFDGNGKPINSLNGAIDVHMALVHSVIVNQSLYQDSGVITSLAVATVGGEYQITVDDSTGFAVGDRLHINTGLSEGTFSTILAIDGDIFTLDRRIDFVHDIGCSVEKVHVEMATNVGTLASPQVYHVQPPAGEVWHITRILFEMTHGSAGDLGKFGGISELDNGVLVRVKIDDQYLTITNWKNNGDIKTDMFDVHFDTRSGGGGSYGTTGRGTFTKTGAVPELNGDNEDRLEIWVQDDISDLESFKMKAQGHTEI